MRNLIRSLVLVAALAASAMGQSFHLTSHKTDARYGPFAFAEASVVRIGSAAFTIEQLGGAEDRFTLRSHKTQNRYGPFSYRDATILTIGSAKFTIDREAAAEEPAEEVAPPPPAMPHQSHLYRKKIADLLTNDKWDFVTIEELGGDGLVQVARPGVEEGTDILVNIGHFPSSREPVTTLDSFGVALPQNWKVKEWEANSSALLTVPVDEAADLPQFIHTLFLKFFQCGDDYRVLATMDTM